MAFHFRILSLSSFSSLCFLIGGIAFGYAQEGDNSQSENKHLHSKQNLSPNSTSEKSTHTHKKHHHKNAHHKKHLHHDFDDPQKWLKRFNSPERQKWQKPQLVIQALQIKPHHTVVDLGTGTGYFLPYLQKKIGESGQILALDIGAKLIAFLKERAQKNQWTHVYPKVIHAHDPQLPPQSVDRILVVNTWHHLPQRSEYILKLKASLKPQGRLLIVDFKKSSPKGPPTHHKIALQDIIKELQDAGFKTVIHSDLSLPDQYMVSGTLL